MTDSPFYTPPVPAMTVPEPAPQPLGLPEPVQPVGAAAPVLSAVSAAPVGPTPTALMPPLPDNWQALGQPVMRMTPDGRPYIDFVSNDPSKRKLAAEFDHTDDPDVPMVAHVDADGFHHRVRADQWQQYEKRHFGTGGDYRY